MELVLARQCAAVDAALHAAELHAAWGDEPDAPPVPVNELRESAAQLERASSSLLHAEEPDSRLMVRVRRLADAHLRAPRPVAAHTYDALCAYGALAPVHHAAPLAALFTASPPRLERALPAVIALAHADPAFARLFAPIATLTLLAVRARNVDVAELAASALRAINDAHSVGASDAVRRALHEARVAAMRLVEAELSAVCA